MTELDKKLNQICIGGYVKFEVVFEDITSISEDEYQQARMDWIGASDSSKLLNVNPFSEHPYDDLIEEKAYRKVDEEISKKASVRMGKDLEPLIINKLTEVFNNLIKPANMYGNKEFGLEVNFDGVIVEDDTAIPVEIKTVTKWGKKYYNLDKSIKYQEDGIWKDGIYNPKLLDIDTSISYEEAADYYGIPVYYYTQLQQQMMALNSEKGYLAILDTDKWNVHIFLIRKQLKCWEELLEKSKVAITKIRTIRSLHK